MNAIEAKFYESFLNLVESGYILQHRKHQYSVIGKTESQPDEEACIECSKYIKITFETYLKKEKQNKGRIDLYFSEQESISGYKLDFFLQGDVPNIYLGIEIDGYEWHEKTKEQASTDKKRERNLLFQGIPCIRFTGSDVYTNADGCAKEALDIYFNYYFEVLLSTPESFNFYFHGEDYK